MPTNVDKAAKAAKKAAREEACAKAKLWSESLKGKGGSGTNVKSTNAAKSPLKPKQKKSGGKSTPKKQSAATSKSTTTNPTETTRKTPSRASRKAAAIANAAKWHDDRQAKNACSQAKGVGCKVPSTIKVTATQIKVETVYSDDEIDDELLSNEDDFKTANQDGTPAKATPTKVAHTPTSIAKEELVLLKNEVENVYHRLSLLVDTVDDAMDCS